MLQKYRIINSFTLRKFIFPELILIFLVSFFFLFSLEKLYIIWIKYKSIIFYTGFLKKTECIKEHNILLLVEKVLF